MMTKEMSTKMLDLMTAGAVFLVLGYDHISHKLEMLNFFFKNCFYC